MAVSEPQRKHIPRSRPNAINEIQAGKCQVEYLLKTEGVVFKPEQGVGVIDRKTNHQRGKKAFDDPAQDVIVDLSLCE